MIIGKIKNNNKCNSKYNEQKLFDPIYFCFKNFLYSDLIVSSSDANKK